MNILRPVCRLYLSSSKLGRIGLRSYSTYFKRPVAQLISQISFNRGFLDFKVEAFPKRAFSTESTESELEKEIEEKLKKTIESEKILIFIKGTPEDPQCKYSSKLISILNNYKLNDYAYINVFSHEMLRKCVKKVTNWPTFPQLFVRGKLIGGCDVVDELHNSGELEKLF